MNYRLARRSGAFFILYDASVLNGCSYIIKELDMSKATPERRVAV
jgi:hypothetical protein